jgi:hypothetical protein
MMRERERESCQLLSLAVRAVGGVAIEIERAIKKKERPLLLKSRRVRRGALEALGPGSPGVLISGNYGC